MFNETKLQTSCVKIGIFFCSHEKQKKNSKEN